MKERLTKIQKFKWQRTEKNQKDRYGREMKQSQNSSLNNEGSQTNGSENNVQILNKTHF